MKRYQVYLNSGSVAILDDFERQAKITRSQIIRETIDRLAVQLSAFLVTDRNQKGRYLLDDLSGFIDLSVSGETNFARQVDDIYVQK